MIELVNIIFVLSSILYFISVGLFSYGQSFKNSIIDLDKISQNLILFLNLIWISSIFNFPKSDFFILLFIISTISFFIIIKKKFINFNIDYFSIFSILVILALSIVLANDLFLSHDSRLFWIEKANTFFNGQFVNDDQTIKTEYPHFGTYLWAFFWKNSFIQYEYMGRIPYLLIYVFSISYLVNNLKINLNDKLILILIILILTYQSKHFDGRQDILIFSYNIFISRFLFEIFIEKKEIIKNLILTILTLNLILWTKAEGILYLIVYGIILLLFLKNNLKLICALSIFSIFLIKLYFYFHWNLPFNPSAGMYDENIFDLITQIDIFYRFYSILYWYLISMIKNPLLLISLLLIFFIISVNKKFVKNYLYIFIFYTFLTAGIFMSYLPTKYDFPFAMIGSLDRVLLQHSGIFLLPILYSINKKLKW